MLCVEKDNSAVKGTFYHDQGYPKASQVFLPGGMGTKQIGFETQQYTPVTNSYGAYRFGDPIAAFKISDEELSTAFGGYLVLPQAVDGGMCVELLAAAFGKDKTSSCLRQSDNLALDCENRFNSMRYISDVFGKSALMFNLEEMMIPRATEWSYTSLHQSRRQRDLLFWGQLGKLAS